MRRYNARSGFTLVEVMIAVAISAIVLMAMISVFSAQQKSFSAQSEAAKLQSSTRIGLYLLARDIRMAAYTGIPLTYDGGLSSEAGKREILESTPLGAIVIKDGTNIITGYGPGSLLANALDSSFAANSDILEIWGNFRRETTRLPAGGATQKLASKIAVQDKRIFGGSGISKPGWLALGAKVGEGVVFELHPVSGLGSGDSVQGTVFLGDTVNSALTEDKDHPIISPIYRRVYYLHPSGELRVRNCYNTDCRTDPNNDYSEQAIIRNVTDVQFSLITAVPDTSTPVQTDVKPGLFENMTIVCDPCRVRAVNITLTVETGKFQDGRPVQRTVSTTVRLRNTGVGKYGTCDSLFWQGTCTPS